MLRFLLSVHFLAAFLVLALPFALFAYIDFSEERNPPRYFAFEEEEAEYRIVKPYSELYWLEYKGSSNIQMFIAKSPVDLEPFLNKEVRIKGEFVWADKQCIVNECKKIGSSGTNSLAVDVYEIE